MVYLIRIWLNNIMLVLFQTLLQSKENVQKSILYRFVNPWLRSGLLTRYIISNVGVTIFNKGKGLRVEVKVIVGHVYDRNIKRVTFFLCLKYLNKSLLKFNSREH